MPRPHYTTFSASDGALITLKSSLPITSPDPTFIPTSPILTFSGPTGTSTSGTAPTGTVDNSASGKAGNRARSASKASVIAEEGPNYSRLILLLHGFSGSSEYFDRNWEELSKNHWVVAWDMRGHGRSGLRRRKAGVDYEAEDCGDEEGVKNEEDQNQETGKRDGKRDLDAERKAGKRDEGTEGQPTANLSSKAIEGGQQARTGPNNNDKRYDTYSGGYHVARLATDLKNMLDFIKTSRFSSSPYNPNNSITSPQPPLEIVAIGCSIGAAILQTYIELFTDSSFSGLIFVDQAPLQDRSPFGLDGPWDASKAHKGCYDEATMLGAQAAWKKPLKERHDTHLSLVQECLGYRYNPLPTDHITDEQRQTDEAFFTRISAQCPSGEWLAKLIADHTRYDHREACEEIRVPVLVMGGKRSGCFSLEGMEEVVKRAKKRENERAEVSWFEGGHWLFWEESERFNSEVLEFGRRCWSE